MNDKEFKVEERLFSIEKNLKGIVNKDDLKTLLKMKANKDNLTEIKDQIQQSHS